MSLSYWSAALLLVAAAATVVTSSGLRRRSRRRAVIGRPARAGLIRDASSWRALLSHQRSGVDDPGASPAAPRPGPPIPGWIVSSPRRSTAGGALLAAGAGALAGGPVAALVVAGYGGLAVRAAIRAVNGRATERERRRKLDSLGALAADLRAGLPVPAALAALPDRTLPAATTTPGGATEWDEPSAVAPPVSTDGDRIIALTRAAVRLAEQTGAPLAELIERIEADARTMDRGLAAAAAQAAGARATAWLLAGLPLGGIALGYGIGVDPLRVLLRTPIGAACAVGALVLQLAGLTWAERLGGGPARSV